jgi:hypothetical protein
MIFYFLFFVLEHVAIDIFFTVYCDEIVYSDEIMLTCNHVILTNNPNMFLKENEALSWPLFLNVMILFINLTCVICLQLWHD